jgi:phosphatidylethanolamine-binding protein (PEBP) family uncharacterized protein
MNNKPGFSEQRRYPRQYTCDGKDINPPLMIANCPQGTKSIALICDDPDAPVGIWVPRVGAARPQDEL